MKATAENRQGTMTCTFQIGRRVVATVRVPTGTNASEVLRRIAEKYATTVAGLTAMDLDGYTLVPPERVLTKDIRIGIQAAARGG